MKKKIAMLAAAVILVTAVAGCGKQTNNTDTTGTTATNTQSDVSENYGTADYSKDQINMGKIDGKELKSSNEKSDYSGSITNADITIEDAKVIEYDGVPVVIVSYKYKNTGSAESAFTGRAKAEAYQDDNKLASLVITGVEGVTMLGLSENIQEGETITVQEAYRLRDEETPVVIEVSDAILSENVSEGLTKTFEF